MKRKAPSSNKNLTTRGWMLTQHVFTAEPKYNNKIMNYLVYAHQKCPTTAKDHWQIYVQYTSPRRSDKVQADFTGAFKEAQKYTANNCRNYIVNDEKKTNVKAPVEHGAFDGNVPGIMKKPGQRNDIAQYIKAIAEGKEEYELMDEFPQQFARYKDLQQRVMNAEDGRHMVKPIYPIVTPWFTIEKPNPRTKLRHWIVIGPPNMSKSYMLIEAMGNMKRFVITTYKNKYDGYAGEDIIVFDDVIPERHDLIQLSNTDSMSRPTPESARYAHTKLRPNTTRTIICFDNKLREVFEDAAIKARFILVNLYERIEAEKQLNNTMLRSVKDIIVNYI